MEREDLRLHFNSPDYTNLMLMCKGRQLMGLSRLNKAKLVGCLINDTMCRREQKASTQLNPVDVDVNSDDEDVEGEIDWDYVEDIRVDTLIAPQPEGEWWSDVEE